MGVMKERLLAQLENAGDDESIPEDYGDELPRWEPTEDELESLAHQGLCDAIRSATSWLDEKIWKARYYGEDLTADDLEFLTHELKRALRDFT